MSLGLARGPDFQRMARDPWGRGCFNCEKETKNGSRSANHNPHMQCIQPVEVNFCFLRDPLLARGLTAAKHKLTEHQVFTYLDIAEYFVSGYAWAEDKEHCEEYGRMLQADPDKVSPRAKKRGLPQVNLLHRNLKYCFHL